MTKTYQFYLTFGQKYAHHTHPAATHKRTIHPDGYVVIHAKDYDNAREIAFKEFAKERSYLYTHDNFFADPIYIHQLYPKGVLFELS